jgi:toxin YoeB
VRILFSETSWEEYLFWQKMDQKKLARINDLIKDIQRNPFNGVGKPEPLRHALKGYWSRRIDHEHRLVYKIESNTLYVAQCRYHY